ncbi:MAG: hypothetical protein HQK58_06280 [Deltaproteobacteria bacterium]|nr:hypothetical protein [Deltaproteobacteria bacterium]
MLNFDLADTVAGQDIFRAGVQQGGLEKSREDVVNISKFRFSYVPPEVIDATNELVDLGRLETLLEQAVVVGSLKEFAAVLGQSQS